MPLSSQVKWRWCNCDHLKKIRPSVSEIRWLVILLFSSPPLVCNPGRRPNQAHVLVKGRPVAPILLRFLLGFLRANEQTIQPKESCMPLTWTAFSLRSRFLSSHDPHALLVAFFPLSIYFRLDSFAIFFFFFLLFLLYNLIPYDIKEKWACVRDGLWSFPFSFIISTLSTMIFPLQYIYVYIYSIILIYRWLWNRSIILPAGLLYIRFPLLFYLFNSASCLSIQLMKGYCQVVLLSFWLREAIILLRPFPYLHISRLSCYYYFVFYLFCLMIFVLKVKIQFNGAGKENECLVVSFTIDLMLFNWYFVFCIHFLFFFSLYFSPPNYTFCVQYIYMDAF